MFDRVLNTSLKCVFFKKSWAFLFKQNDFTERKKDIAIFTWFITCTDLGARP